MRATSMLQAAARLRPIVTLGAPVLRKVAAKVPESMFNTPELDTLVDDMVSAMRNANGAGIAAPQIGEPWRVFVVHGTGKNPRCGMPLSHHSLAALSPLN
eukprot:m.224949 g.224949  ORF g.224949 m.224949 type:complete len:100 (+) comp25897_c0_seq1:102-401(+)